MHEWETRMLLKHYLDRGVSKAELSTRFGVSRRTIHMGRDRAAGPGPVVRRLALFAAVAGVPQAGPVDGIIDSRLEEFPGLSAKRLFDEVRAAG